MPKKRKGIVTLSPKIKSEIKEEKTEPLIISGAGDVLNARDRLKGVLQELLDHSDDSSAATSHDDCSQQELIAKQAIKKVEPVVPPQPSSRPPRSQRRRRRREAVTQNAFHHTYVMKLFDRSVDLAQFKEDTPLHPICRAWMANQPRNTNLVSRLRTPTPEPQEDEPQASSEGGDSGDESDAELVRDTYKMPPPMPTLSDSEIRTLRTPAAVSLKKKSEDIDMDLKTSTANHETLLQNHIQHWVSVRNAWHAASHKNEARFQDSGRILKAIYKKAQKAYE